MLKKSRTKIAKRPELIALFPSNLQTRETDYAVLNTLLNSSDRQSSAAPWPLASSLVVATQLRIRGPNRLSSKYDKNRSPGINDIVRPTYVVQLYKVTIQLVTNLPLTS